MSVGTSEAGSPAAAIHPHTRRVRVEPGAEETRPASHLRRRRLQNRILGIGTPVIFFVLWQLLANNGTIDTRFFPAPTKIVSTAIDMIQAGTLQKDLLVTLRALAIAFVCGFLAGTAVGALLGLSRIARAALEPLLSSFYTIPKLALLPLLLLIFGVGELPKIILVALGVFFIAWISMLEAVLDIPEGYLETARSFGIGKAKTFRQVVIPAVLPQVFVGLRISVGNAILIIVGVEFVSGSTGIGYRIWNSWLIFAADRMYVGIVVVALLGFVLTKLVEVLSRVFVPWAPRVTARRK
jgi:ABC-type nitrate/sulfonate/bicarbonate transport system permease component